MVENKHFSKKIKEKRKKDAIFIFFL